MPYKDPEVRKLKQVEYARRWREKANWNERRKQTASYANPLTVSTLEARRAYWAVHKAVKAGTLIRPDSCSACGARGFIEGAHTDYSRPLDVTWLCRPCHRQMDHERPNYGKETIAESRARIAASQSGWNCLHCGQRITEHPGRRKYCSHPCYVAHRWG